MVLVIAEGSSRLAKRWQVLLVSVGVADLRVDDAAGGQQADAFIRATERFGHLTEAVKAVAFPVAFPQILPERKLVTQANCRGSKVVVLQVDIGQAVPGGRLPGPVADRLPDFQGRAELRTGRRVVALLQVDAGQAVPGGRLPGPVADRLPDFQ